MANTNKQQKTTATDAPLTFPDGDLSLEQHLQLLGWDAEHLAYMTKLPQPVIDRALQGGHVTLQQANAIIVALNREHAATGGSGLTPESVKLNVWKLNGKHMRPVH